MVNRRDKAVAMLHRCLITTGTVMSSEQQDSLLHDIESVVDLIIAAARENVRVYHSEEEVFPLSIENF